MVGATSSVGRAHPHVEIKIVDRDGATVPRGTAGELLVRGYLVMQRYWADEEKTADCAAGASRQCSVDDEGTGFRLSAGGGE